MEGTERAFERLVLEHQDRIYALGLALTGNRHDAEEVAQDTFLRAYRALVTYSPDRVRELKIGSFFNLMNFGQMLLWHVVLIPILLITLVGAHILLVRVRGVRPRLVELNGSEPSPGSGPEEDVLRRAEVDQLAARVACLPPRYREAVVLRHVQELSYAEVADALGQPVGTVKANVHRGLKILRGENHGDGDD